MKDHWWCVTVFWKTGEVQSIWTKNEGVAWEVLNKVLEGDQFDKVKLFQEQEKPNGKH